MEVWLYVWHVIRLPLVAIVLFLIFRRSSASSKTGAEDGVGEEKALLQEKNTSYVPSYSAPNASQEQITESPQLTRVQNVSRKSPRRIKGSKPQGTTFTKAKFTSVQPIVFYSSLSGQTEAAARKLNDLLEVSFKNNAGNILKPYLLDLSYVEYDDYFTTLPSSPESTRDSSTAYFYMILVPTYNIDTILTNFIEHLKETHHDFRIDTAPLSGLLGYAVFGFGDKEGWPTEKDGFCSQAREIDVWMSRLTGKKRAYPLGMGNVKGDATERLNHWRSGVEKVLEDLATGQGLGDGVPGSGDAQESEEEADSEHELSPTSSRKRLRKKETTLGDLEALQEPISEINDGLAPVDFTTYNSSSPQPSASAPKEMVPVNSPTYASLTKQGYTIVGSHSGVKICRWTKSALRGRGSCYKFSFYGIKSHLCMETTPSLSCSNKCVFCWRHGTNPVGTTWRWQVDPPNLIFAGVKEGHYKKIKMLRGVPGVRAERFEEAMKIRHCALSLVGEPIFYPHINEFVSLLHNERISSFLVCNAQHPTQLADLKRVTQLYVSIDAPDAASLRRIDRPLHRDFWERFLACMDVMREQRKRMRTVFRLTLVKGFNLADAAGYAALAARALPCFIEVKGVTYCGTSTSASAGLSMQNVPFYEEVVTFVEALNSELGNAGLQYGIAAEHAHSCCILLADERFKGEDGRWKTVIDYERFFELLESGQDFGPEDYCKETPEWALFGNGGFDPADERVFTKGSKAKKSAVTGSGESKAVVEI